MTPWRTEGEKSTIFKLSRTTRSDMKNSVEFRAQLELRKKSYFDIAKMHLSSYFGDSILNIWLGLPRNTTGHEKYQILKFIFSS